MCGEEAEGLGRFPAPGSGAGVPGQPPELHRPSLPPARSGSAGGCGTPGAGTGGDKGASSREMEEQGEAEIAGKGGTGRGARPKVASGERGGASLGSVLGAVLGCS